MAEENKIIILLLQLCISGVKTFSIAGRIRMLNLLVGSTIVISKKKKDLLFESVLNFLSLELKMK